MSGLRSAGEWPDAQRELRERYADDSASLTRRPGHVSWSLGSSRFSTAPDGTTFLVTVEVEDEPDRAMTFEAARDLVPPTRRGRTDGMVVGEFGANAATGVELAGGVIWPVYNPTTTPADRSARAARVVRNRWVPPGEAESTGARLTPPRAISLGLAAAALLLVVAGQWARHQGRSGPLTGWVPFVGALVLMVAAWCVIGWDSRRRPGPGGSG